MAATEIKSDLQHLHLTAAKELELDGGRKAIIIFVPFRQLKDFHKVHPRLVRELEKKFRYVELGSSYFVLYERMCLIVYPNYNGFENSTCMMLAWFNLFLSLHPIVSLS
jgi:hypothetical protein